MANSPFGAILEGYLTSQQVQAQRAAAIAEETWRSKRFDLEQSEMDFRKSEAATREKNETNRLNWEKEKTNRGETLDYAKLGEEQYQFDQQQQRFAADRTSRENVAKIKGEVQKAIAEARNLSMEDRLYLNHALRGADSPEEVQGLLDWMRSNLGRGGSPQGAAPGPQAGPQQPVMEMNPALPNPVMESILGGGTATPGAGGFDPSQPWGGQVGAQIHNSQTYAQLAEQRRVQNEAMFPFKVANEQIRHRQMEENIRASKKRTELNEKVFQLRTKQLNFDKEKEGFDQWLAKEKLTLQRSGKTEKDLSEKERFARSLQAETQHRLLQNQKSNYEKEYSALKQQFDMLSKNPVIDGNDFPPQMPQMQARMNELRVKVGETGERIRAVSPYLMRVPTDAGGKPQGVKGLGRGMGRGQAGVPQAGVYQPEKVIKLSNGVTMPAPGTYPEPPRNEGRNPSLRAKTRASQSTAKPKATRPQTDEERKAALRKKYGL